MGFFLSFGLGCLSVSEGERKFGIRELWNECRKRQTNFVALYACYHHFRGKGWVVRSGSMFGADFALYKDGIPFTHASYLVYAHMVDRKELASNSLKAIWNWKRLHCLSRVNIRLAKE